MRREERRAGGKCVQCGKVAVVEDGVAMSLCGAHRFEYEVRRRAQQQRGAKANAKRKKVSSSARAR
jgi:predicted  nucleic acid-binding Zn-ribbon protein